MPLSQTDLKFHYPHFLTKSLSINQVLLLSTHPVIFAASRACIVNGWIHTTPSWRKGAPRYDTILVEMDPDYDSMQGTDVAQVKLLLSLCYDGTEYHCALVDWFSRIGDSPDEDTGLWVVEWDCDANGHQISQVIDIDTII